MSLLVNSLFRKYAGTLANLDLQESQAKQQAGQADIARRDEHKQGLTDLSEAMATRGLAHSGISLGENVKMRKAFDKANADADAALQTVLTNIAKQRLAAKEEYDANSAADKLAQLGIGG